MGLFGSSSPFDPLMDKACNEQNTAEDWSLILSICDKAKSHPKNGLSSIIKKMQHKVPRVALQGNNYYYFVLCSKMSEETIIRQILRRILCCNRKFSNNLPENSFVVFINVSKIAKYRKFC